MIDLRRAAGPLMLDAAMGTALLARGLALPDEDAISWSLSHPREVAAVHRAHVEAGAQLVLANTFGSRAPAEGELRAALSLAREGGAAHVAAALSPGLPPDQLARAVDQAARAGAELIWLETAMDPRHAAQALALARARSPLPVAITLALAAFPRRGANGALSELSALLAALAAGGAAIVGVNCGPWDLPTGAALDLPALVSRLAPGLPVPFALKPDSGRRSPASWAELLGECARAGAVWLGGCCGTDARHLRELRARFSAAAP